MHNSDFENHTIDASLESTAHQLWQAESLHDCIRRGILMANFRVSTQGENIYVHFGNEAHQYPRPDDAAIERIVEAFKPRVVETPPELDNLPLDEARFDG